MAAPAAELEVVGAQVPRLRVAPAWTVRPPAAVEAVEMSAAYGLVLDGWQDLLVCDALVERPGGTWESTEIDEVCARQNGKNGGVRCVQLYKLYAVGNRALHTAHEFKTAREHFDKMLAWIEAYDDLRREVKKVRTSHGEEGILLRSGAELRFVARSSGSGRGFDPDDLYYDEALILTRATLAASLMAQSASPNPQRWFFSSAGTKASEVLGAHRLRALAVLSGRRPRGRFVWHEYSADFDGLTEPEKRVARRDPQVWALANPGMPHRIDPETIVGELDSIGDGPDFDRERLSVGDWPTDDGQLTWAVIDERAWTDRGGAPAVAERPAVVGYGVASSWPGAQWTSIARCFDVNGERVVELVDRRPGTAWVRARLAELRDSDPAGIGLDPAGPASAVLSLLEVDDDTTDPVEVGALDDPASDVQTLTSREAAQAAAQFVEDVTGDTAGLRHYGQQLLTEAVGAAGKHQIGDLWRWDRTGSSDPLEAATLARLVLVTRAQFAAGEPFAFYG